VLLTREQLDVADDVVWTVAMAVLAREETDPYAVTVVQRVVLETHLLDGEVGNGGFNQVAWNGGLPRLEVGVDALRVMGADEHAAVAEAAVERLRDKGEELAPFVELGTLEAFAESYELALFDDLDLRWSRLPDLRTLQAPYIWANLTDVLR
jgi:hypothetical protein